MQFSLRLAGVATLAFALSLGGGALIGNAITGDSETAAPVAVTAPSASGPTTHHVALTSAGASPSAIIARLGDRVQFDAQDGRTHSIAQGSGDDFGENHGHAIGVESEEFGDGEAYLVTIPRPGLYFFHDHEHPELTVSVVVYEQDAP